MQPAKDLQQLETRVIALKKNFSTSKAELLDASTKGWSYCAVGLALKDVGIDIDVAKQHGCVGSDLVTRVCGEAIRQHGSRFNTNLYSKKGLQECLNFIRTLRNMPTCQLLNRG